MFLMAPYAALVSIHEPRKFCVGAFVKRSMLKIKVIESLTMDGDFFSKSFASRTIIDYQFSIGNYFNTFYFLHT